MKKSLLTALAALFLCLGLAACTNTVEGVGRDIENAGQSIQNTF